MRLGLRAVSRGGPTPTVVVTVRRRCFQVGARMEGRVSTFEKVLADFESRLKDAEYVAIDTELTGVDIEGEIDTFEESAAVRLEKICRVAERYSVIQVGLTLVGPQENGHEGGLWCASYNLFAFPYVSQEMNRDPVFMCQATALRFNVQHRVDFNTWIGQGIPYITREDERDLKNAGYRDEEVEPKVGLLRLWRVLCAAQLPFVVHCPLDLFFLLAAFERRPLPRRDPRALALLIRQCTPKVYDTAHLHGAVGRFRRLGLSKFFEDAKARHAELIDNPANGVEPVDFTLIGETAVRYSKPAEEMAHEAGYDSLMTAQLFAYLRAISPSRIVEAANRLFLYRSIEFIDIGRACVDGVVGCSMFDLSRVTLLVAALDPNDNMATSEAPRLISAAGAEFKWMDATHILVVLRASGGAAIRKATQIAAQVQGVENWLPFEQWREMQAQEAEAGKERKTNGNLTETAAVPNDFGIAWSPGAAASSTARAGTWRTPSANPSPTASPSLDKSDAITSLGVQDVERQRWTLFLQVVRAVWKWRGVIEALALLAFFIRLRRRAR